MTGFSLTPAQQTAIYEHTRSIAVNAGAGSGKTFILTSRFIALLEAFPAWRLNQIVAVTFTRKAAAEMRDRVRDLLLQRADAPDASPVWRERLNEIDSARITTIHGLCGELLKANATEAHVDPDFTVLDENEAAVLRLSAVESALGALPDDDRAARLLYRHYTGDQIVGTLSSMLASPHIPLPDDLFADWKRLWSEAVMGASGRVVRLPEAAAIGALTLPVNDKLSDRLAVVQQSLETLRQPGSAAVRFAALTAISQQAMNVGKAENWGSADHLEAIKDTGRVLKAACDVALKETGSPPGPQDRTAAALLAAWHSVCDAARARLMQMKRTAGALDFEDLERLTRDLLRDDAVAARYDGAEFQHVMLDEFQDTSAVQWEIARRIASPSRPGGLFIVGDPKQSIYAFRGADPTVFETAQAQVVAAGGIAISLDTSFRTHRPLVDCFNQAFTAILVRDAASPAALYQSEYTPMGASRGDMPDEGAPLHILALNDETAAKSRDETAAEVLHAWEAQALAAHIAGLLASGRLIYDKRARTPRPCQPGDIALLAPVKTSFPLYEEALRAQGIPFVTVGGAGFYARAEVWDLIHLLTALHNRADELALAAALRSPLFAFSDEMLLALRLAGGGSLWDALHATPPDFLSDDSRDTWRSAAAILSRLGRLSGRASVATVLAAALDETGYLAVLAALPDGARRRLNVEKLLDIAMQRGGAGLSVPAFARYISDIARQEVRESEAALDVEGAVQIMTVHASKGLEFPIVLLAECGRSESHRGPEAKAWHDPLVGWACAVDLAHPETGKNVSLFARSRSAVLSTMREAAERQRLLYVAATRAQDLLVLCSQVSAGDGTWYGQWVRALGLASSEDTVHEIASAWGGTRWHSLAWTPPPVSRRAPASDHAPFTGIDHHGDATIPPLTAQLDASGMLAGRALKASNLADLSRAALADPAEQPFHRERWRRAELHDAPAYVERFAHAPDQAGGLIMGEIVHRALQWHTPGQQDEDLRERLSCYAWEKGVVGAGARERIVGQALELLRSVLDSRLYAAVAGARQSFRELSFSYETGGRTVHGVIDALVQFADGRWAVIDYKTSWVRPPGSVDVHAHTYLLQAGLYAAAACEQLDTLDVDVYIHYIRHRATVHIPQDRWRAAVTDFERVVGQMLES